MTQKTGRPRNKIERKAFNTKLSVGVLELLHDLNEETGIPMNRLIEDAINEKYGKPEDK